MSNFVEVASDTVERIDPSVRHEKPGPRPLETWLKSLPFKPVKLEVHLPPRDAKPVERAPLPPSYRYDVLISGSPTMEPLIARFEVTADSACLARHFGARFFLDRPSSPPPEFWIRADLTGQSSRS